MIGVFLMTLATAGGFFVRRPGWFSYASTPVFDASRAIAPSRTILHYATTTRGSLRETPEHAWERAGNPSLDQIEPGVFTNGENASLGEYVGLESRETGLTTYVVPKVDRVVTFLNQAQWISAFDLNRSHMQMFSGSGNPPEIVMWDVELWGWPCSCVYGWKFSTMWSKRSATSDFTGLGGSPSLADGPIVVPTIPIWSGIAVDCAAWTIGTLLVLQSVSTLQAWMRKRNHRCVRCNYRLEGLTDESPCPECGGVTALQ